MKRFNKKYINSFGIAFLMFAAAFFYGAGCATPDPVKGWKSHNANFDPPNLTNYFSGQIYHIDKTILDDYPKFVEQLKKKYPYLHVSEVDFYEDGTGEHAVKITVETNLREYSEYFLMYGGCDVP